MKRRAFLAAGATAALVGSTGCVARVEAAETTVTDEFAVEADQPVRVTNRKGDLTIRAHDGDAVEATLHKRDGMGNEDALSKIELEADRDGGSLSLAVEDETDGGLMHATHADLELRVPTVARLSRVRVDDGDLTIRETRGDLTVWADDGEVNLAGIEGDVAVTGDDGDVVVSGASGTVDATVDDGDVTVRDPGAVGTVESDDGNVEVDVPAVDSGASIRADDGDVTAAVSQDLDAQVTLSTDDGDVEIDEAFGVGVADDVGRFSFEVGSGEGSLRIRTDDGDVELRPLGDEE